MPFRSLEMLESWLGEFRELGYPIAGTVKVIPQDREFGSDTGLVGVRLMNAQTVTYIQPVEPGSTTWVVTFEARDTDLQLDAAGAFRLSTELAMVSALCTFLQTKSKAYMANLAV
ncbi:hypothetical protein [Microbacterium sp. Clip185]|uniref:hypothetical protein n=1 Tax=Microbacterium sp. Clip185 TaxID=3025663 RepID=UPI002365EA83|nr:hypothetical protein [Microbacterium sp. Clip185]WDG16832.1 hypothetical protein PQV94_09245 [Microbacterium sp. Clip185]